MEGDNIRNCGDCRNWEEEHYWNRLQSFSFFQILSSVPEFHNQLAIPKKFANNARALLPTVVTLRGPSRASWSAVMIKTGDDTFLTDGWVQFVRAYSLKASDVLIFKFDGVSAFDIQIFDGGDLCEKESAYFVKKCGHENYAENPRKRASTEDDIEEYSDGLTHRATKQAREEAVNVTRNRRKKHLRKAVSSKASPRKKIPLDSLENMSISSGERGQSNVQTEPSNNEPWNTEMNPLPSNRSFSTETQDSPQHRQETNGRCSNEATKVSSSKVASSVGGPRKQLGANKAKDDFALGKPDLTRTDVSGDGRLALITARKQMTGNSFIAVMRPTTVCRSYALTFPRPWCRKHLSHVSQDLFLRFGDKTFLTRLSYSPRKTVGQVIGGWKRVVDANQLKLDDVCLFKIASRKDDALMLDVSVFRAGLQQTPNEPGNGELSPKAEIM